MRAHKHDAILKEYFDKEGFPLDDRLIASICGIPSKSTVQLFRKENGIPSVKLRRAITDAHLRASVMHERDYVNYVRHKLDAARAESKVLFVVVLLVTIAIVIVLSLL